MANGADNILDQAAPGPPSPAPQQGPGGGGQMPGPNPVMAFLGRGQQGPQPSAPGPGQQADSMNMLMMAIKMMKQAYMGLSPGSREHRELGQAINRLDRIMPQIGQQGPGAGIQKTLLSSLLGNLGQSPILQALGGGMGSGGGGGGAGGPPQPAPPSLPLPGA